MKNILSILLILIIVGVPRGTHAAKKDLTDNVTYNTPLKSFGAADDNDQELYDILSGTTPTLGPLDIGGTGDSVLFLSNNTTLVDDITGKYGIRFSSGVLQQIINGTPSSISSGGSSYVATPTYSDDPCTIGQYSFDASYWYGCEATDTWDRFAVTWLAWDNPEPVGTTYFVGMNNDHTTVMDDSAPSISVSRTDSGHYNSPTLPAGSEVVAIHVYKVTGSPTAEEVSLYSYTSSTEGGALLSQAPITTTDATWTRAAMTTGARTFGSITQVFGGYAFEGTLTLGRKSASSSVLRANGYGADPLGTLTTSTYEYAIILEYTAP